MTGSDQAVGEAGVGRTVTVLGAGLGGLSAAASLAAMGFKVRLFEKNDKIGGKLNFRRQDGFSFDLGPSIIILPHLFRKVWERAGRRLEDYVDLEEINPQWRCFWEDGVTLDLHGDMAAMERELAGLEGGAEGYWSFMEYSRKLWRFAERAYMEPGADRFGEVMRGRGLWETYTGVDPMATMARGIARHVKERHLQDMLGFFIKYVGSSCYDAPALMNLLPYSQLGYGLWYVRGGMYNLARGYEALLGELGVEIVTGREAVSVETEGGQVRSLVFRDGGREPVDWLVSNMEVLPFYKDLAGLSGSMVDRYERRFAPAASGLVIHLGVDKVYPQLAHHNFFFSEDLEDFLDCIHRRKQLPEDPTIYLVNPGVSDPSVAPEGCSVIKILPHVPPMQDPPFSRDDYAALEQRVFRKLERMGLEDLEKHAVTRHVLVPDDLRDMYLSNRGAIYGVVSDRKKNFALKAPKQSEAFSNLFFVGGSVNPGGGTPMVTLCGQLVADLLARSVGAPSSGGAHEKE